MLKLDVCNVHLASFGQKELQHLQQHIILILLAYDGICFHPKNDIARRCKESMVRVVRTADAMAQKVERFLGEVTNRAPLCLLTQWRREKPCLGKRGWY